MAGSERVEKSGVDSGPTSKNGALSLSAVNNNVGLTYFQCCCEILSKEKGPIQGGKKITANIPWKEYEHARVLVPIFNGTSLAGFVFCISQDPDNSGETWCTLKFAKIVSKVRANVVKEKDISIKNAIKEMEKGYADAHKSIEGLNPAQLANTD